MSTVPETRNRSEPPDALAKSAEQICLSPSPPYVKIPARYADADTSDLTVVLEPGENSGVDFTLEE